MYNNSEYMTSYERRNSKAAAAFPAMMKKVFAWMAMALAITGFVAYGIAGSPDIIYTIATNRPIFWALILGEFGLVIWLSAGINRMSFSTAIMLFALYSVVNGVTLSFIFLVYTMASITSVFFITAGMFGTMALLGYTTKTDLTSFGKIMFMALIGLIIATIVNMFIESSGLQLICSYIGVLIFTGLTAYDTQKLKTMLAEADDADENVQKYGVLGALTLYLDFINLFLYLLRIFGNRRD